MLALALAVGACRGDAGDDRVSNGSARPGGVVDLDGEAPEEATAAPIPLLNPPPADPLGGRDAAEEIALDDPLAVVALARRLIASRDVTRLADLFVTGSDDLTPELLATQAARFLGSGEPSLADSSGRRAIVRLGRAPGSPPLVLFEREGRWRIDLRTTALWREPDRGPRDPDNRPISLDAALADLESPTGSRGEGDLVATLETSAGTLSCRLFAHRAPATVANFVGLARGLRAFIDSKTGAWVKRPFYDGLTFHRVVPGALAQGGDPLGSGRGGPGYTIADELDASLRHDRPGILSMASRGPNTAGSQFFVTAAALPELDDHHSVFGVCDPVAVVEALAATPSGPDERPTDPLTLTRVTISRR